MEGQRRQQISFSGEVIDLVLSILDYPYGKLKHRTVMIRFTSRLDGGGRGYEVMLIFQTLLWIYLELSDSILLDRLWQIPDH